MDTSPAVPALELYSRVDLKEGQREWLERHVKESLSLVLENPGKEAPLLGELDLVEMTLVTDETIAQVHAEFLNDPTPTDVITFHHGEILVSEETARRVASQYERTADEEILLYLIHGLLHLHGHTDHDEPERERMHRIQEDILSRILAEDARNRTT